MEHKRRCFEECSCCSFPFVSNIQLTEAFQLKIDQKVSKTIYAQSFKVIYYYFFIFLSTFKVIAHWVRNFRTLKNKYDLTLCQSRLHTASEIFVRHKQICIGFDFFPFFASVASILRVFFDSLEPPYMRTPKSRMVWSSSTSSRSTKHCRSLHTEFTEMWL